MPRAGDCWPDESPLQFTLNLEKHGVEISSMDFLKDFASDPEFSKLLGRRDDVDLTIVALELARDHCPQLDFQPTLTWVDDCARRLGGPLARAKNDEEVVGELLRCLAGEEGLHGTSEDYNHEESSFLNRVVERKSGLPIALSLVYMAVANKAGLGLQGVAAPRRFLTRYETPHKPLFIDAFGGKVLNWRECVAWVQESAGLPSGKAKAILEPAGPRPIIIRMLSNLKGLYSRQENWRACWKVQHRLLALSPAVYSERRDWGLISLNAGRSAAAIDMLASCIATAPNDEREVLTQHLADAKKQQARWN